MASVINSSTSAGVTITSDTSGVLALQTASTTALTVTAAQLVGIGTASPSGKLHVSGGSNPQIVFDDAASRTYGIGVTVSAMSFYDVTGAAERMRIPAAGGLQVVGSVSVGNATPTTSGAGITFPATQSASSNANTLDDYEEGDWTPTLITQSGSAGSTNFSGNYIKIGRQVTVTINATFTTTTSLVIDGFGGLPFTVENTNPSGVGSIRENSQTGFQWHLRANGSLTTTIIRRYDNSANISNNFSFIGTLTYFTT
jgi:hypothetical protein